MTPSGKFDDTPAEPDAEQCWLPPLPEKRWEAFGILLRLDSTWRAPCQCSFLYWVQFNQINLAGLSTRASWSRGLQPCFAKTGKMVIIAFSIFHLMISIFSQRAHNLWLLIIKEGTFLHSSKGLCWSRLQESCSQWPSSGAPSKLLRLKKNFLVNFILLVSCWHCDAPFKSDRTPQLILPPCPWRPEVWRQ